MVSWHLHAIICNPGEVPLKPAHSTKNRNRYFTSTNIPKKNYTWRYENETELNAILEHIKNRGFTFISKNTFDGYVKADYIKAIKP